MVDATGIDVLMHMFVCLLACSFRCFAHELQTLLVTPIATHIITL